MRSFFFKYRGVFFIPLAILLLLFGRPTLLSLLIGLPIALLGEAIRIWGVGYAGATTRKDSVTAPFLVTAGPFAYVRNPLYIGNTVTGLGFVIFATGGCSLIFKVIMFLLWAIVYPFVYGQIIPYEEEFLKETFGTPYLAYCKKVNRIIPSFKSFDKPQGHFDIKAISTAEKNTLIQFAIFTILMILKMPRCPLAGRLFFS